MLYQAYSTQSSLIGAIRPLAAAAGQALRGPWPWHQPGWGVRKLAGVLETFADLMITHERPPFGIEPLRCGNRLIPVVEEAVYSTPFATLLHFRKEMEPEQPRVLLVAPMSGHFATLLRATAATMLTDHDVYITDWHNIRDVPAGAGRFDFAA
ncbi:MAG TPA: polyhydroxyalkanoate depolymerase, partial [Methylocella sp.]|nr:polyhydroxyalkanoate depolymerase [Methylocella sp.]